MELMTRAGFLKMGASLLASGALAACGASSGTKNANGPYSGQIGATSYPGTVLSVPILAAFKRGFFKQQKLNLQMVVMNSATDLAKALNSEEVAFGVGGIVTIMNGFAAGLNQIRLIGQEDGAQYITFLAKANSPAKAPSDLKGKKVAVLTNKKNLSYWMALQMLKAGGLTANDVNFVFLQSFPAITAALENGIVDVGASFKPVSTQQVASGKARTIWDSGPNVVGYPDDGIFTAASMASDNPQICQRFASAMVQAQDWVRHNVEDASTMWAQAAQLDPKITLRTLNDGLAASMTFPVSTTGFDRDRDLGVELGTVPKTLSYGAFVDGRFQKAAA